MDRKEKYRQMKFAELLRQERIRNKLSLRQLARLSGLPLSSVAKYESGEMEPTLRAAHTVFSATAGGVSSILGWGTRSLKPRHVAKK